MHAYDCVRLARRDFQLVFWLSVYVEPLPSYIPLKSAELSNPRKEKEEHRWVFIERFCCATQLTRCLNGEIVAAIGRADDRLVWTPYKTAQGSKFVIFYRCCKQSSKDNAKCPSEESSPIAQWPNCENEHRLLQYQNNTFRAGFSWWEAWGPT